MVLKNPKLGLCTSHFFFAANEKLGNWFIYSFSIQYKFMISFMNERPKSETLFKVPTILVKNDLMTLKNLFGEI